jgi:hypothetical protein
MNAVFLGKSYLFTAVRGDYVDPQNNGDHVPWLFVYTKPPPIPSLNRVCLIRSSAFKTLELSVVLQGIKENLVVVTREFGGFYRLLYLISFADIRFPPNIATNGGVAQDNFELSNPFGATIKLESIIANATHHGLYLGVIDLPQLPAPFVAPGHANVTSPNLPLQFDIDPLHIIQVVTALGTLDQYTINLNIIHVVWQRPKNMWILDPYLICSRSWWTILRSILISPQIRQTTQTVALGKAS